MFLSGFTRLTPNIETLFRHQSEPVEPGSWNRDRRVPGAPEQSGRFRPDALPAHFHNVVLRTVRPRGNPRVHQLAHPTGIHQRLSLSQANQRYFS